MNTKSLKRKVQVVVIAESDLLLLEFNNTRPGNYVGFQNITGEVEGIETYVVAALREVIEEIGVDTSDVHDLKMEFNFHDRWKRDCHEKVFLCYFSKKPEIKLSEEHLNFKWKSLGSVEPSDYTFPTNFEAFTAAKSYVEKNLGVKK